MIAGDGSGRSGHSSRRHGRGLSDLLVASARRHPNKLAVASPTESVTFEELALQADRIAGHLGTAGLGRGDRVAMSRGNDVQAIAAYWAVLRAGCVPVDLPPSAAPETLIEMLEEAAPRGLIAESGRIRQLADHSSDAVPDVLVDEATLDGVRFSGASLQEEVAVDASDVATVIYTSGSSGRAKGVMLSHDNWLSNLTAIIRSMELTVDDSILVVVPLHFVHGRMQLHLHAAIGGTLYLSAGWDNPEEVVSEVARHGVTGLSGVPFHFRQLLRTESIRRLSLPHLKYLVVTGGKLAEAELDRLAAALPDVGIHVAYGQTEASPRVTHLGPREVFGPKRSSVGRPLAGITVDIVGANGRPLACGEVGEVAVRGPNVMVGYVTGDEGSSGAIDRAGRLRTGDVGYLDADGYLYLVGRTSGMIKSAGERIFSEEVERVVDLHPSVSECAVLGVPDEALGERLLALVVLKTDRQLTMVELRKHCLRHLPFVRVPRGLVVVDELPKTRSGKLDRARLTAERMRASTATGS